MLSETNRKELYAPFYTMKNRTVDWDVGAKELTATGAMLKADDEFRIWFRRQRKGYFGG